MNKFLLMTSVVALAGCSTVLTTVTFAPAREPNFKTVSSVIEKPVPKVASVGSPMITNGYFLRETISLDFGGTPAQAVDLLQDIEINAPHKLSEFKFNVPKAILKYAGETKLGSAYSHPAPISVSGKYETKGGLILDGSGVATHLYWLGADRQHTYAAPLNGYAAVAEVKLDESLRTQNQQRRTYRSPTRSLIYSGLQDGKLSFTYRQHSELGELQPAYSHQVTLDYSPGKEYAFQEARFRILRADVADVEYEVLQEFNIFLSE